MQSLDDTTGAGAALAPAIRYDPLSMTLHWLIAALVVVQFALAELWDFAPRPTEHLMVVTHMSLGLILTALLLLRLAWRLAPGHAVEDLTTGLVRLASRAMHHGLYVLLVAQVTLGILLPWTHAKPISFFGLAIPSPFGAFAKATGDVVAELHDVIAWTIVILAAGHAGAALVHHVVFKDNVLRRMLPSGWLKP